MAIYKSINGKRYQYKRTMGKVNAKRFAKLYRKKGFQARVIKESRGWALYVRKK